MRLTVTLAGPLAIAVPVHYNYLLQAAIYAQIEQPALRKFLHEQGFTLGRRRFKLFTFSRLLGPVGQSVLRLQRAAIYFYAPG